MFRIYKAMGFLFAVLIAVILAACEPAANQPFQYYQSPAADPAGIDNQLQAITITAAAQESANQFTLNLAAIQAQGTLESARTTAGAISAYQTGTVEARDSRATQEAQNIKNTQRAQEAQATKQAWAATATADSSRATTTVGAQQTLAALAVVQTSQTVSAGATREAGNLAATQSSREYEQEKQRLALERQIMVNRVQAFFGYALVVAVFLIAAAFVINRIRIRPIPRGGLVIMNGRLVDPDLAPTTVTNPMLPATVIDAETASRIKENQQKIEALRAMPGGRREDAAQGIASGLFDFTPPKIEIISPAAVGDILGEVETKLLDDPE